MDTKARVVRLVIASVAAAVATAALAYGSNCPIDNSSAYFTGQTRVDVSGKLLQLWKCNQYGHEFWVPAY
jgi:hypothetical protein